MPANSVDPISVIIGTLGLAHVTGLAAVYFSIRQKRLLGFLAACAAILSVLALPRSILKGYDLGTFLLCLPVALAVWALAEVVLPRDRSAVSQLLLEEDAKPRMSFSLRTLVLATTSLGLCFGLMSGVRSLNRPRDITGRFVVRGEQGDVGVENVLVFFYPLQGPPVTLPESEPKTVTVTIGPKQITPEIAHVRPGDTLCVKNKTGSGVSPLFHFTSNPPWSRLLTKDAEFTAGEILSAERVPVPYSCSIKNHRGYLVVTDSPVAISDAEGNWTLPHVPVGEHQIRIWHQRSGWIYQGQIQNGRFLPSGKKDFELVVDLFTRSVGNCVLAGHPDSL